MELLPYRSNSHAVAEHGHLNGIAWTCHLKHLDADLRTSTLLWELLKGQRLFAPWSVRKLTPRIWTI
jgi:hypothetical protein